MNAYRSRFLSDTPPVTRYLIIINLVMFGLLMLSGRYINLNNLLGMYPVQSPLFQPWQIVTHMFMHGGLFHIAFNMYALWIFGRTLEMVWGSQRFLLYYLLTGLGAAFFHQLIMYLQFAPDIMALKEAYSVDRINMTLLQEISRPGNEFLGLSRNLIVKTVGASGAVYGVLLGFAMLFPNTPLYLMFIPIPIKAKWLIIGFFVMELYLGFQNVGNVAHFAHLGGMIFGFIMIKLWNSSRKNFY